MYQVEFSRRFKRSLKRVRRSPKFKPARLKEVIGSLSRSEVLDRRYKDHALSGDMLGLRECHLAPDILLIYRIDQNILTLTLIDIGSHSKLLKK